MINFHRKELDVDVYLSKVEKGRFSLVKYFGRGIFVKFTEKKLSGDHMMEIKSRKSGKAPVSMPENVKKFWYKRFTLFEKFDEGV